MITGPNGTGKTSVLEALAYLGTRRSFRGAPPEAMVRTGCGERHRAGRDRQRATARRWWRRRSSPAGRSRTQVNRKAVNGRRDLGAAAPCTIFSPEDLAIVSGGPQGPARAARRRAGPARPRGRPGGRRDRAGPAPARRPAAPVGRAGRRRGRGTLDVWDQRLADAGKVLVAARERLVADLEPLVGAGLQPPGRRGRGPGARAPALRAELGRRPARRARPPAGATTCAVASTRSGPHRDDLAPRRSRARGPDPRLPGRAALPGPGPAPRACTSWSGPGRPWSRPCCSTTCSPSSTRPAAGPWWRSCPPGRRSSPRRHRCPRGSTVARVARRCESLAAG